MGFYIVRPNNSSSSYLEFLWGDGSPSSPYKLTSNIPITPNQWNLATVTFNKNQGITNLYINSQLCGTYNNNNNPWGSLQNFIAINIGSEPSSIDEPITLDELMIYNRVLSQNEISQIYNSGTGTGTGSCVPAPCGLVAWYYMDGNTNDYAALGGYNNPSATNGIQFVPGKVGQGVKLNQGGYIEIPDSPALQNQEITIDAWVKPMGPGPNNDQWGSPIVVKGFQFPAGQYNVSVSLWWSTNISGNQKFAFGIGNVYANWNTNVVVSNNNFTAGNWYHVAATYDGYTMKLYVNGQLEGTKSLVTNITYDNTPWTIGSTASHIRAVGYPRTFNGIIDEVEIFDRALSTKEIQRIYNAGSYGKCKMQMINPNPNTPTP